MSTPKTIHYATGPTPLGTVLLAVSDKGLCYLKLLPERASDDAAADLRREFPNAEVTESSTAVRPFLEQVNDFLGGKKPDIKLDLHGTPFQLRVWQEMQKVPWGKTISYSELARRVRNPKAVRAVGSACARNPVPLVVPCHRILRKSGDLGGYGGGLHYKEELLRRERETASR